MIYIIRASAFIDKRTPIAFYTSSLMEPRGITLTHPLLSVYKHCRKTQMEGAFSITLLSLFSLEKVVVVGGGGGGGGRVVARSPSTPHPLPKSTNNVPSLKELLICPKRVTWSPERPLKGAY